jgi:carbon storage regulator
MARPVLGIDRIVLDCGVEPEPVALLAVVEGAFELAAAAATTPPAPAATAAATLGPLAALFFVLLVLLLVLHGLGIEGSGDQRVILGAQVEIVVERDRALGFRAFGRLELVIALELAQILHGNLELMGDPGVGPALSHPRPDLIQLWTQGSGCHRRANLADTCKKTFVHPVPGMTRARRAGREASRMLVLTRKSNQSIMIGDDIEVSVLAVMGEKVRIGISAPRDVPVFRKEVYLEIKLDESEGDQREAVARALEQLKSG